MQQLKRYEAALASYDRAIALETGLDADAYYRRATVLLELEENTAAVASFDKAIALGSSFAGEANHGRGIALGKLQRWDEALAACERAVALKPSSIDAAFHIGVFGTKVRRWNSALFGFDSVIAVDPAHPTAHFNRGLVLCELQRWGAALNSFDRAIELVPGHAEAFARRAGVLKELGQLEAGLESSERALALNPNSAQAHSCRSAILANLKQWRAALTSIDRVIDLKPDHANGHFFRGLILCELEQWPAALASLDRAIELQPCHAQAHLYRGDILTDRDEEAAVNSFHKALAADCRLSQAYERLGTLLKTMGRADEVAPLYRSWLEVDPTNPIAGHLYAAASGENVPERCAARYVTSVFDNFASSFDATLARLGYAVPGMLSAALAQRVIVGQGNLDVLDAGCGTGLCGPLLRPAAKELVGVDLSSKMLAEARRRLVYDDLIHAELAEYMASRPQGFDIVNCADTFVYIGALEQVMSATRRCLRRRGVFAFTTESLPEGTARPYKLTLTGRYAHSRTYLLELMAAAGFSNVEYRSIVIRREAGSAVDGYLFIGSVVA